MPDGQKTLAKRILVILASTPWLTATALAKQLSAKTESVASVLLKLSQKDGPLKREDGHGPRGGYGYALKAPWKTRYELIVLEDWL